MGNTTEISDRIQILVCCHKRDVAADKDPYMPIHVGKALSGTDLGMQGDDTGDNISSKNRTYCELTGMYWAWKNLHDADIIGLCHYRRYFDFHHQNRGGLPYTAIGSDRFAGTDFSIPPEMIAKIRKGNIVVARRLTYQYSMYAHYCVNHVSEDLRVLEEVVKEMSNADTYSNFRKFFLCSNSLSPFNMFIMDRQTFEEYCGWLFPILEEVEKRLHIDGRSDYQKRVFGFMAERLLNVFLYSKRGKTMRVPVLWFNDDEARKPAKVFRKHIIRFLYNLSFFPVRLLNGRFSSK